MTKGISTLERAAEAMALHAAVRLLIAERWHGDAEALKRVHEAALTGARTAISQLDLGDHKEEFMRLVEKELDDLFGPVQSAPKD